MLLRTTEAVCQSTQPHPEHCAKHCANMQNKPDTPTKTSPACSIEHLLIDGEKANSILILSE